MVFVDAAAGLVRAAACLIDIAADLVGTAVCLLDVGADLVGTEVVWANVCECARGDDDEPPPQPALAAAIAMTMAVATMRISHRLPSKLFRATGPGRAPQRPARG